ncbi:MAG: hypothetical protein AAGD32_17100 [Planctomycetota bacterium]
MDLQELCESGQQALMRTEYIEAEALLVEAEAIALKHEVWETLARLYMPLQEARRQRRQLCGEGIIAVDLVARAEEQVFDAEVVADEIQQGQLLVAGWGTIEPSVQLREIAQRRKLYVETFLAVSYPVGAEIAVAIVPTADVTLPPVYPNEDSTWSPDALFAKLPPHSVLMHADDLPKGRREGNTETFAATMAVWEKLHAPFLAAAKATPDPRRRIDAYRSCIAVDYACEKAHQWLSDTAAGMEHAGKTE